MVEEKLKGGVRLRPYQHKHTKVWKGKQQKEMLFEEIPDSD